MPVLNQLQRTFALAHAAFARNHQAHTVYIHQYAVAGLSRRKGFAQECDGFRRKNARFLVCAIDRHIVLLRPFQQCRRTLHAAGDDDAGNMIGKIARQPFIQHIGRQTAQIRHLRFTDDLRPFESEYIEIAGELQSRTAKIRLINALRRLLARRADGSQPQCRGELMRGYAHSRSSHCDLFFIITHPRRQDHRQEHFSDKNDVYSFSAHSRRL